MIVKAIRGAITVDVNSSDYIKKETKDLLETIIRENNLDKNNIISAIFTMTDDLDADFPAVAAREIGWEDVPLLCTREIKVPGSVGKCIRILLHVNLNEDNEIKHIYLKEAKKLRPDLKI